MGSSQAVARYTIADLTDDELVLLARDGDGEALEILLERYTSYARSKARTYFMVGADREDIVQEGMIGLFRAVRDFDTHRSVPFRSFAELCIARQVLSAIKMATRQKHAPLNSSLSLYASSPGDDESERQLVDFLASAETVDPIEVVVQHDDLAETRAFLQVALTELEARALDMYLQGRSYQHIARVLDREAKSIDNALQRVKRKLEVYLRDRARGEAPVIARPTPQPERPKRGAPGRGRRTESARGRV